MKAQAVGLSPAEIDELGRTLGAFPVPGGERAPGSSCSFAPPPLKGALERPHWTGWGVDPEQRRFQPAAMAQLAPDDVPRLRLKWAFGFPGVNRAYAQPAVVGSRLFVGSADGRVYSLDARSGCVFWSFNAGFPVRTAISVGSSARGWAVYFGDQHGYAHALDADTGAPLWSTRVDEHPLAVITGAPLLAGDRLFVPVSSTEEVSGANPLYPCCSFRGSVVALDSGTGKVLWHGYTIPEAPRPVGRNDYGTQLLAPSGAAIWSAPTLDRERRRIYVTTGDSYSAPAADTSDAFVAFDMETGALAWSRQMTAGDAYTIACGAGVEGGNCPQPAGPDLDFGSSPILLRLADGKRALIAGQKSGVVHAVDPDREGAILWQRRIGRGGKVGGIEWGAAADDDRVYVALSDVRTAPAAAETEGAQKSVFGPSFRFDPASGGGLFALDPATGAVLWHTPHPGCGDVAGCSPAQSAAVTAIPGIVFSGGLDGHLRAYEAATGKIVWDVDTRRHYVTANGVAAQGGSIDGPGAVVVGGMVYVNSGYAFLGGTPGNVLLAFSVDGR
jgi:polyvinyl alcohol dehydrogenase (cytochrome)